MTNTAPIENSAVLNTPENVSGTAIILIGHGSLRSASGASMIRIAARLRTEGLCPGINTEGLCPGINTEGLARVVEPAFLNFSRPTLADALQRCAEQGAHRVVIQPYFLIAGAYVRHDLPQLVERTLVDFPQLAVTVAEAFGHHAALVSLARDRVLEAAPALTQQTKGTEAAHWGLLLMAHGTPLTEANAPLEQILADLLSTTGIPQGCAAYLDCNSPTIPAGIDRLARAGVQNLVALPYFLHLGRHVREDLPTLLEAARARLPQVNIIAAQHLDYDLRLVDVIRTRLADHLTQLDQTANQTPVQTPGMHTEPVTVASGRLITSPITGE